MTKTNKISLTRRLQPSKNQDFLPLFKTSSLFSMLFQVWKIAGQETLNISALIPLSHIREQMIISSVAKLAK